MIVLPDVWLIHIEHGRATWKAARVSLVPVCFWFWSSILSLNITSVAQRVWKNWYARLIEVDRDVRRRSGTPDDWLSLERSLDLHDW